MDILGIGPLELIFILIIALIVLGPSDMVKAGRTIGRFLRNIVTSPTWHAVTRTSKELRNLPNKLMRDAGLEDDLRDIQNATKNVVPRTLNQDLSKWQEDIDSWTTPPSIGNKPGESRLPEGQTTPQQNEQESNTEAENTPTAGETQDNQEQVD
jgi:Sec-independent protein translocase protein TatA